MSPLAGRRDFMVRHLRTCEEWYELRQRYTYRVLQTIQMKLILLCVWAELAVLSTITALKFNYEI